jgi:hypothetical protein
MRLSPALLLALSSLAFAGGKACRIARPEIPTPGLDALIDRTGVCENPAPKELRLSEAQVDALYDAHESLDRARRDAMAPIADIFQRGKNIGPAPAAPDTLPETVTAALLGVAREVAWVIDPETSGLFHWARLKNAPADSCEICRAVRTAVEAPFAFTSYDFPRGIPEGRRSQVAEAAAILEGIRKKWAAVVSEELTKEQLAFLRGRQEEWLDRAVRTSLESALRSTGEKVCASCQDQAYAPKCGFCDTVREAVLAARKEEAPAR